jgi:hypothetical protein
VTVGNALHATWQWLGRVRRRFRLWRRGRPFWGGLILMLAGAQLWLSTNFNPFHFEISFGPTGFLVILLPLILLLCGFLVWFTPQHRVFYGVIGTVTAIYSLLGLNLGGWFIGTLLGILGGSLVISWTPIAPHSPATADPAGDGDADTPDGPDAHADDATTQEQPPVPGQPTGPLTDATPDETQVSPVRAPRQNPRTFVAAALPLLMTAAFAAPLAISAPDSEPCPPEVEVTQELTGEESEEERRTLLGRWYDWWTDWWTSEDEPESAEDVDESSPSEVESSPSPSPSPSPAPSPSPSPTEPCPEPSPTAEPGPSATSTAPEDPPGVPDKEATGSESPEPTPAPELTPPPVLAVSSDQPLVSADPALMTADRLDLRGFRFEGIVDLPTAEGTITTLKFTFDRASNTNFTLMTNRASDPQTTTADTLVLSGDVEFYASRLSGNALGFIPMTLEADSPTLIVDLLELIKLPLPIFFTDVEQELVFTHGATLTATGFGQS